MRAAIARVGAVEDSDLGWVWGGTALGHRGGSSQDGEEESGDFGMHFE